MTVNKKAKATKNNREHDKTGWLTYFVIWLLDGLISRQHGLDRSLASFFLVSFCNDSGRIV